MTVVSTAYNLDTTAVVVHMLNVEYIVCQLV